MFLVIPPLLLLYVKNEKYGSMLIYLMLAGSLIAAYAICWKEDFHAIIPSKKNFEMNPNFMFDFYVMPYIRISAYLLGLIYGIQFRNFKNGFNCLFTSICIKVVRSYYWQVNCQNIFRLAFMSSV